MENETQAVDLNNEESSAVVQEETQEQNTEEVEEVVEEKPQESLEARRARLQRQLDQTNKKLGIETEKPKAKSSKKSNELELREDYGKLSYLKASGIEDDGEIDLVDSMTRETGKNLRDLVNSKYFKSELKDFRDNRIAKEAVPSASKRSNPSGRDTIGYWLSKGELPPSEQIQLRRDVLNARIKQERDTSMFSKNPIVSN